MSNENSHAVNMHFDSLTIYHGKTNVVQADSLSRCIGNYYPFGLAFNSFTRSYSSPQNFKFNGGSELNEITGNYETFYRNYDPVLGRFNSVDIKSELYASQTPYQFAGNNPIFYNDPLGDQYSSDREEWNNMDMNYGYNSGRGSNNSGRFGDSWANGYRSVEANLGVMGRSGFRDFYGISDGFGGVDTKKATDLAKNGGLIEKGGIVTVMSVGVNGMGDGNGNIIPGTESYHIYSDHYLTNGEYYNTKVVDPNDLGRFLFFMGLGAERIHDLAILGNKSAEALVRNAAARGQAAGNKGLKTVYNKTVGGRMTARVAFRGIAYVGIGVDFGYSLNHFANGRTGEGFESMAMAGLGVVALSNPAGMVLYGGVLLYQATDCPRCGNSKIDPRIIESDNTNVSTQYWLPGN